jgi:hypothetical protein
MMMIKAGAKIGIFSFLPNFCKKSS